MFLSSDDGNAGRDQTHQISRHKTSWRNQLVTVGPPRISIDTQGVSGKGVFSFFSGRCSFPSVFARIHNKSLLSLIHI